MAFFSVGFLGRLSRILAGVPKDAKEEYRQFYFRSDIAQARIVIVLLALL